MTITRSRRACWALRFMILCALLAPLTAAAHTAEDRTETRQKLREFNAAYQQESCSGRSSSVSSWTDLWPSAL